MNSTTVKQSIKGGEWLITESLASETFIPEEYNEEQKMVKDMCSAFVDNEVLPVLDRIDKLEEGLMPSLIQKAGDQGLLCVSIPEEYGGSWEGFYYIYIGKRRAGWWIFIFSCSVCAYGYWHTAYIIFWQRRAETKIYT